MMKRFFFLFGLLLVVVPVCIAGSDNSVTMVSYEQSWLDSEGTIALKNNTNEDIRNISFQITYLDMSGKPLDYEEYIKSVNIAPGMTKKVNIPAYEHERNYHYYKTKDEFGHPAFKIEFKLFDYNIKSVDNKETSDIWDDYYVSRDSEYDSKHFSLYFIIGIVLMLFFIGVTVGLYVLVALMAQKRNRSVVAWILLSFIGTPLLMIIILLCIGDSQRD